jgi:hypothetical protein
MVFRDDREALRERVDALEQELAEAKSELRALKGAVQPNTERSPFFGAPLRTELVREIDGELSDESKEIIVEELRRRFGRAGQVSSVGRSITWSIEPTQTQPSRAITVNLRSRNGRTVLSVVERHASLAGGLFAGMGTGMGFGGGAGIVAVLALVVHGIAAAIAAPLWLLAVYALARTIFVSVTKSRRADLCAMMDALVTIAKEDMVQGASAPTGVRVEPDAHGATEEQSADAPSAEGVAKLSISR